MQYTTSYNDVAGWGSKYIASQTSQSYAAFNAAYPDEINELGIAIKALKGNPSQVQPAGRGKDLEGLLFQPAHGPVWGYSLFTGGTWLDSAVYKPAYDPSNRSI